jgi:cation transport protein ChaC
MTIDFTSRIHDFWVFGYGSLIWRPGFEFVERVPARLIGLHRSLCVYSYVHRGTQQQPGLVMGLDRGGACRGVAFRIEPDKVEQTVAYLRLREQATSVYVEALRDVTLVTEPVRRVRALVYLADRNHVQYAGKLSIEDQVRLVRQGRGSSGINRDYVIATVEALESIGCFDQELHLVAEQLKAEGGPAPAPGSAA